jgi:hypothetical protein
MNDRMNNTRKIKNITLAIEAAPAAIPPNPKMAAIIATTRKITVQRNIVRSFLVKQYDLTAVCSVENSMPQISAGVQKDHDGMKLAI